MFFISNKHINVDQRSKRQKNVQLINEDKEKKRVRKSEEIKGFSQSYFLQKKETRQKKEDKRKDVYVYGKKLKLANLNIYKSISSASKYECWVYICEIKPQNLSGAL